MTVKVLSLLCVLQHIRINKVNYCKLSKILTLCTILIGNFIARLIKNSSCREFEVDSINFAGQTHRWRLSGLLQRGRDRRRDTLLSDLALATRFLVVTARARLISHCFSVSQSLKALITGLLRLLGEHPLRPFVRFYYICALVCIYVFV